MKPLNTISALTLANLGHAQLPPLIAVPLNIPSALGPTYRKLYQFCIDSFAANPDVVRRNKIILALKLTPGLSMSVCNMPISIILSPTHTTNAIRIR
jgi:hypothetical protein